MAGRSLLRVIILGSLLLFGSASGYAQQPLSNLVSQVNRAVALVSSYNERGHLLTHGSGFFIAPDRIVTKLHLIDSARDIRIKQSSGATISVRAVVARYPEADVAILQLGRPAREVTALQPGKISRFIMNGGKEAQWNVTVDPADGDWSFQHIATGLQVMASINLAKNGDPIVKLKAYVNGTASSVLR